MFGELRVRVLTALIAAFMLCGASPASADPTDDIYDPIEGVNRGIFWFNDKLDVYLLEPVARGYDHITPDGVQHSITNFFKNLRSPSYVVSDLVQGKFDQVGLHTGRFLINTTLGVAGLFDVAEEFGLEKHEEDFGVALAYRGVPSGPYLVLPLVGPSNVRDAVGLAVDTVLDPLNWLGYTGLSRSSRFAIQASAYGLKLIHTRAGLIQAVETAKESSLDYYLFVQSAYYQYRYGLMTDGKSEDSDDDDVGAKPTTTEEGEQKKALTEKGDD